MTVALKNYQQRTLDTLESYLADARLRGPNEAYTRLDKSGLRWERPYQAIPQLENTPYCCLRVPTGGGKTLLSIHSIKVASDRYLETEYPLVLLLVPLNPIRSQTIETLQNPNNANYQALSAAFDGRFKVIDIADFATITPQDLKSKAVVIVGTVQTLRVASPEGRKVYAHNENLEPHFSRFAGSTAGLELQEKSDKPKFSFRNLLHSHRPLVLMDESQNASTDLSFEVYRRINPACIIEYTATPKENSNILVHISASELKAEEMIKLPIVLNERPTWEEAVADAIRMRRKLAEIAAQDESYIRPIVLFQAESQNQTVTHQALRNYLLKQGIAAEQIATVTGDQRELEGINLFDPTCKIEYVITVQALKEGWDCSFAYVFCSLANTQSAIAIEQLLGRVLRMPYAKRRTQDELNRAYAFVSSASWKNSVQFLHDALVDMGFEKQEARQVIETTLSLDETNTRSGYPSPQPIKFQLNAPIAPALTPDEQTIIKVEQTGDDFALVIQGEVTGDLENKIAGTLRGAEKTAFQDTVAVYNAQVAKARSPAERREPFNVPQLCVRIHDMLELADRDLCMMDGWNLLSYPIEAGNDLVISPNSRQFEIDIEDGKVKERHSGYLDQLNLNLVDTGQTEEGMTRWLCYRIRPDDLSYPVILEHCRRFIKYLVTDQRLTLPTIDHAKFIIAKYLSERLKRYRQDAARKGFQKTLLDNRQNVETSLRYDFHFGLYDYAPRTIYEGSFILDKHYYPVIGDLKATGEEFECAKTISMHPQVKFWVRNIDRSSRSFWLPTSTDKFYPDFVVRLEDGRTMVIEFKGEDRFSNDDSDEKRAIGDLWQDQAPNKDVIFLMARANAAGLNVHQQIEQAINKPRV